MKKLSAFLLCVFVLMSFISAQTMEWAKRMGAAHNEEGISIAVDDSGNVYSTGFFKGTVDFDPNTGSNTLVSGGEFDIFVQKLDKAGGLVWAKRIGGIGDDIGTSIALNDSGHLYVLGTFKETVDFDPNIGVEKLTSNGSSDIFLLKLDQAGNFIWVKSMGGIRSDGRGDILLSNSGNIYITGNFQDTVDFDPNSGTYSLSSLGRVDFFISKLDAGGNLIWAKSMGGSSNENATSISIDNLENIYITGSFQDTVDFDPSVGTAKMISTSNFDIFVLKLDQDGNYKWVKTMLGTASTRGSKGNSLKVDDRGNVYIIGNFYETVDFDPNQGVFNLTSVGEQDVFVQKLDSLGNLVWVGSINGLHNIGGNNIIIDRKGELLITGSFVGTVDFDLKMGVKHISSLGPSGIYIQKLDTEGNLIWIINLGGADGAVNGNSIETDSSGSILITGEFTNTIDFDPTPNTFNLKAFANNDIFVLKLDPNGSVGLDDFQSSSLTLSPNPSQGLVQIALPSGSYDVHVQVVDLLGKTVYHQSLNLTNPLLDISHLTDGIYYLNLTVDSKEKYFGKLMLKK